MSHLFRCALLGLIPILVGLELEARAKPPASRPQDSAASRPSSPSSEPAPGDDLDELRRFEESAFPHPAPSDIHPVNEATGTLPRSRARPSTEAPPPGIHSDEHQVAGQSAAPSSAPQPWLAKLARPDLPIRWDAKLIRYLEFYKSNPRGRAIMSTWLRRAGRYTRVISQALRRHQLPQSLLYVAMIESGFNPKTTSRAGATGIWQFMLSGGYSYGLTRDHWIDERRNPEKSTEAALRYLKDLYRRFGSWELALAAYNAGHGGVVLSMRKYNTNDYWQLCRYEAGLPWDTVLYVPKILAAAVVGANRGVFGFDQIVPEQETVTSLVSVPTSITLAQAAVAAGVSKDLLEQLNPELQRGRTPPGKSWLRVPKQAEQRFYAGLASIKGQLARYKPYLVRLGDTLADVARAHGISISGLRSLNGFAESAELRAGLTILVPARTASSAGGTSQADTEGSVDDDVVLVPLPSDRPSYLPGRRRVFYRTVMGDSLDEIAKVLGVSRADLASWNALDESAKVVSGMVLQAFVAHDFDTRKAVLLDPKRVKLMPAGSDEFYSAYEERRGRKRITYLVRDGDTLASVGKRFGLTVGDVMRINQLGPKTKLHAGQKLVLYVESHRLQPKRPRAKPDKGADEVSESSEGQTPEALASEQPVERGPAAASCRRAARAAAGRAEGAAEAVPAECENPSPEDAFRGRGPGEEAAPAVR